MIAFSAGNALWTFWSARHYRLFEANVEQKPGTPSAHRVRVQSSPVASSPLRLIADVLGSETAQSRAHPDSTRDVWEVAVWDPWPACLQIFGYFSPLHVLMYMFELPLDPLALRPSVTLFKCVVVQAGLSLLIHLLQSKNDQRQKDAAIIQKEVMREYDTKFVHPRLNPVVRDVSTQVSMDSEDYREDTVESGTPTTLIRRGFQTHPNPNYVSHLGETTTRASSVQANPNLNNRLFTPATRSRHSDSFTATHSAKPRQSLPAHTPPAYASTGTPAGIPSSMTTGSTNFGGSMGVFTHSNSPLKKTTSMGDINNAGGFFSPRNSRELAAIEQREATERMQRRASPLKERGSAVRRSFAPEALPSQSVNPFVAARPNVNKYERERFPSRW